MLGQYVLPGALDGVVLGDHLLEVGPGPGRTTDLLREMAPRLSAVEVDAGLAAALSDRMAGTNVEVFHADATALPFPDAHFSAAVSFIMLHHVPDAAAQDALLAEVRRVLRPGGVFAGADSFDSPEFREMHVGDVCNPVDASSFEGRLLAAGFTNAEVRVNPFLMEFRATR